MSALIRKLGMVPLDPKRFEDQACFHIVKERDRYVGG